MALLEKQLVVKRSTIPGSGKGLFTKKPIPKGARVVEYKGRVTSWKEADHDNGNNPYLFYVKRYHVIDARPYLKALARYANDADGLQRIRGVRNNCVYVTDGLKVYMEAVKDIPAGSEIFVQYGAGYWKTIRANARKKEKMKKEKVKRG